MSRPLGMTTARMLGAAALSAPMFAVLYSIGLYGPSLIWSLFDRPASSEVHPVDSADLVSWLFFGVAFVMGFSGLAALLLGFPLSLLARRLLRHARRPFPVIAAAFAVGMVAAGIATALLRPLLFPGLGASQSDFWGTVYDIAVIELAAGLSGALAWALLWRVSPERAALRSQQQAAIAQ